MERRTIVCYLGGFRRRLEQLERISSRFPSVDQSSRFAGVPNLGKPLYSYMENLDWTLDWTGLFFGGGFIFFEGRGGYIIFLVCKKSRFQPFPNRLYFFFWGGGGTEVVLYRLYSSLLFVGFVLCLSFLVWVGA